jgi:MoxR-like ATPase
VLSLPDLVEAQKEVDQVTVDEAVVDYVHAIISATRTHEAIVMGVSTRGGLAFLRAARARAIVHGRSYAIPDDVSEMAAPVLAHRIRVVGADVGINALLGESRRDDAERIIHDIVARIDVPL